MSVEDAAVPPPGDESGRRVPRRARPIRFIWAHAIWSGVVGVAVMLVATLGLLAAMGRTVEAPSWVRAELSERIETALDGSIKFEFGDIALVAGEGWRPRVRFRDLVLSRPDGQELLRLSDAEVSFSVTALLQGEVRPKKVLVTGVFANLAMDRDGAVSLTLGSTPQPLDQARNMAQLIESWDVALDLPILSRLSRLEIRSLTLRYENARAGRAWTVDGGQVTALRSGRDLQLGGTFSLLSGRDYASLIEASYSSRIGDLAAEFGFAVTDIAAEDVAAQSAALNWLEVLRAPISGAFRGSIGEDGALGPVNASLQIGPGVVQPTDSTRPIPFEHAGTYLTFTPSEQTLKFEQVSVQSAWVSGLAEGTAYLHQTDAGRLEDLVAQVRFSDIAVNPRGFYETPMQISDASADFRLELAPFRLQLGQLQVADDPGTLLMSGQVSAAPEGWDVSLDSRMDRLTPERLLQLWPRQVVVKPRKWVEDNLFAAALSDVDFALRALPGQPPQMYLDFDFADATARIVKWLPPVTGARGTASLLDNRFAVTTLAGAVDSDGHGAVDVSGTSFVIPDTRVKPDTPAQVELRGSGPVAAVMALLNRPPLSVLKSTTLPVDLAKGTVRVSGRMDLPLKQGLKFPETDFHVVGFVEDVDSSVLVPGHRITADQLEVDVNNSRVQLSGPAEISGVPVTGTWQQPIGEGEPQPGRLDGRIELSQNTIDAFGIGLPKGSVTGTGEGAFTIDLAPGKPPALTLTSNLTGARLSIPGLGWSKPAKTAGLLTVAARLGDNPEVSELTLSAAGLTARGRVTIREDGGLDRAAFSDVRVGNWFTGPVTLVGQGKSAPVAMRIGGGSLDMQRATFGSGGGDTGSVDVALNRLKITESIVLTDFRGKFGGRGGFSGTFSGLLGGRTPVTGEVVPQDGRSAFRITSADAGGVLRDSGLLTQARGGAFTMTLKPVEGEGIYDGSARIRNLRVTDAPAIAAVLDAASIVGLIDELAGPGILFGEVLARFRLSPDRMVVYRSSAEGPSIGLSMDGDYDIGADRLNMQGVISPIYMINGIGSVLTRRGEGLIGFNYKLSGPAGDPRVQVNPLSALAPGILREAFRDPPPKDPTAPEPGSARSSQDGDPEDGDTFGGR